MHFWGDRKSNAKLCVLETSATVCIAYRTVQHHDMMIGPSDGTNLFMSGFCDSVC